jgi:hypothetical protein
VYASIEVGGWNMVGILLRPLLALEHHFARRLGASPVTCKRALSNLRQLGRNVISDVDFLHLWTLSLMEKLTIQGLATPESGRCDFRFNRTPNPV